jgi:DNA ligase-4
LSEQPVGVYAQDSGDFAGVAYWILKPRCPEKGTLSIQQVNEYLDEVAKCNSDRDKAGVRRNLLLLLKNTSAKEQKWLIRMILKQLKIGLSQQTVFSVFHEDAEDVFNVKTSLEKVCARL